MENLRVLMHFLLTVLDNISLAKNWAIFWPNDIFAFHKNTTVTKNFKTLVLKQ